MSQGLFSQPVIDGLLVALIITLIAMVGRNSVWLWRLHDMHNKYDDSGRPMWYASPNLDCNILKLTKVIEKHSTVVENQSKLLDALIVEIKRVPREVVREIVVNNLVISDKKNNLT